MNRLNGSDRSRAVGRDGEIFKTRDVRSLKKKKKYMKWYMNVMEAKKNCKDHSLA